MSRCQTVIEAWLEYTVGLDGGPAVKTLEAKYRTAWRKGNGESKFFSRRRSLYKEIEHIAEKSQISLEEAAEVLEARRLELKFTLSQLQRSIQADKNRV